MIASNTADHAFLGGRLVMREPVWGHRSGTDAVILAAAARLDAGDHLIDVGCGAGAVALAALVRREDTTATLIERDPRMAALAAHNVRANGFAERADVSEIDVFDRAACSASRMRRGDVVVSNPPFYLAGSVRPSTNPQQAASHVLADRDHGDWFRRVLALTTSKGRAVVIHRPEALSSLLSAAVGRASVTLRFIHPRAGGGAIRVLVMATMGSRAGLAVDAPLILHELGNAFTPQLDDLHRGRGWL